MAYSGDDPKEWPRLEDAGFRCLKSFIGRARDPYIHRQSRKG
jgi:hypothetical protein